MLFFHQREGAESKSLIFNAVFMNSCSTSRVNIVIAIESCQCYIQCTRNILQQTNLNKLYYDLSVRNFSGLFFICGKTARAFLEIIKQWSYER